MSKSKIRKSINRKFNLGNFQNLDIFVEVEEEIEYKNSSQYVEKANDLTKRLILDFINSAQKAFDEMNLQQKIATVSGGDTLNSEKQSDKKINNKDNKKSDKGNQENSNPLDSLNEDFDEIDF